LGLSSHSSQKLSIKIEIDQKPPSGFKTVFSMVNKEYLIGIQHYDLPSMFSGKLHAILCRSYAKGRDYYDWLWFVGKKIEPNLVLLEQAILQTEGKKLILDKANLAKLLCEKVQSVDFKKIKRDILPFLMDSSELRFFEESVFLKLSKVG
ncbi:MAG: nucleotidyl transferase AbiEii/AbiGii toxin family protein, partial [Gammaproteobacteria bacterium]|nr:nucleotidyl transferase AbiEii/AbiGii toxin family protein [Gammaproteobacteria bacterium]